MYPPTLDETVAVVMVTKFNETYDYQTTVTIETVFTALLVTIVTVLIKAQVRVAAAAGLEEQEVYLLFVAQTFCCRPRPGITTPKNCPSSPVNQLHQILVPVPLTINC